MAKPSGHSYHHSGPNAIRVSSLGALAWRIPACGLEHSPPNHGPPQVPGQCPDAPSPRAPRPRGPPHSPECSSRGVTLTCAPAPSVQWPRQMAEPAGAPASHPLRSPRLGRAPLSGPGCPGVFHETISGRAEDRDEKGPSPLLAPRLGGAHSTQTVLIGPRYHLTSPAMRFRPLRQRQQPGFQNFPSSTELCSHKQMGRGTSEKCRPQPPPVVRPKDKSCGLKGTLPLSLI